MHLFNDFHWGREEEAVGKWKGIKKRKKSKKLCPLHDADLEVGGKWKNQVEGKGTESCHLPKSQKTKCQKAGLGKSFEPFWSPASALDAVY